MVTATVRDKAFVVVYERLFDCYGPQYWWPAQTTFEMMIGAILTQNTAWINVERTLTNLKRLGLLNAQAILQCPERTLTEALRPSRFFNVKARRLHCFCRWFLAAGGLSNLQEISTTVLREKLLDIKGIGPETADDMLLYAFGRPVFVIDAYTRRLFSRLGLIHGAEPYDQLRERFELAMQGQAPLYNEYHALIVRHGKEVCQRKARCTGCVLSGICSFASQTLPSS